MEHHPTQEVEIEQISDSRSGVVIIRLRGPLTIHNFFEFQNLTRKPPEHSGILLIDCAGVPYIDSAALGSFVGLHVSSERTGRKYALVNVNERLQNLFKMCAVDHLLVTYGTVADAEASLV